MEQVQIFCENTGKNYPIEIGKNLREVKKIIFPQNHNHILGALVNNELQDLQYIVMNPKQVDRKSVV